MTVRSVAKRWVGGVTLVGVLLGCGAKMEADLDGAARRGEAGARGSAGSAQVVAPTGGAVTTGPAIWAEFSIRIQAETGANPGYVNLSGAAYDAPPLPVEVTVKEIGECKLVASTLDSCAAAPCDFGIETCVSTNRCMALPLAVDAGNAIVVGLANDDGSHVTALSSLNGRYMAMGLAYPACAPGALIRLDGGGNTDSPFTVHANCIEPLELRGPAFWPMEASKPAEFTWVPASTPENSRISVIIDVEHYSAHPVRIRCNTADTGSLRVDAELITALIELGTTHMPRVYLWRVSSRSVPLGSGAVTLEVVSGVRKFLDIPGVPFCDNDGMCPTGMLCLLGKCVEGT